jgi:hypothetical protein
MDAYKFLYPHLGQTVHRDRYMYIYMVLYEVITIELLTECIETAAYKILGLHKKESMPNVTCIYVAEGIYKYTQKKS